MSSFLEIPIEKGWAQALLPAQQQLKIIQEFLDSEAMAGFQSLPQAENILRAFRQPFDDIKVLIVGQDPYQTPSYPVGLSFSVNPDIRPVPRSLQNIFTELGSDIGLITPKSGDLRPWSKQGVLLLNRVLSVRAGVAGSHRGKGWEAVTDLAIKALVARNKPLVAVLWGNDAIKLSPLLGNTPIISSAHPSPLSARRGFFGSKPFSRVNELLVSMDAQPIEWALP